jgi:hypothetical protein
MTFFVKSVNFVIFFSTPGSPSIRVLKGSFFGSPIQKSQSSSAVVNLRNVLHRLCKPFPAKVRIPAGSLDISVSKQLLNLVQTSASVHQIRSKTVAQIVNPKLWHAGPHAGAIPTVKETDKGLARLRVSKNSSLAHVVKLYLIL